MHSAMCNAFRHPDGKSAKGQRSKVKMASHAEYQAFVVEELKKRIDDPQTLSWLQKSYQLVLAVFLIDFTPIQDRLAELYSHKNVGHPPYDPQAMIRSLMLMSLSGATSITNWVRDVAGNPLWAIFAGFHGKTPSVGAYYDFFKRLENGTFHAKCEHRVLPSEQRQASRHVRRPAKKPEGQEKEPPKKVIEELVEKVKSRSPQPVPRDLERLLNEILAEVAVKKSAEVLHLDLGNLVVAIDGSTLASSADCNGKPTCDCRKQGIYRCQHDREFSDPDAVWGWNNRKKDFVFGYRFLQMVCPSNIDMENDLVENTKELEKKASEDDQNASQEGPHDLPIYVSIAPANTHEVVMGVQALERIFKQAKDLFDTFQIGYITADAIYDIVAFYEFLGWLKIYQYVIPYGNENEKCIYDPKTGRTFSATGAPICPGGLPMRRHQTTEKSTLYCCPIKRLQRGDGKSSYVTHAEECPKQALCEPDSKLGPSVCVGAKDNLRINPKIERQGKLYQKLRNLRSTVERSNAAKKNGLHLKDAKFRVMSYAFIRVIFASILEHSKAWVMEILKKVDKENIDYLALFTA